MKMQANNFVIDTNDKNSTINNDYFNVVINEDNCDLFVKENHELSLTLQVNRPLNISLKVDNDTSLKFGVIGQDHIQSFKFNGDVGENSELNLFFADFSSQTSDFDFVLDLNGKGAKGTLKIASLASSKDYKKYNFLINHKNKETYGLTDSYGVAKDESFLSFIGNGHIYKGMTDSKAQQNCRIMVFDENAKGIVKPTLQIDDNEIAAGHLAILGKINPEQMFYMTSRGLTETMAKDLITRGYLNPILNGFDDEETKDLISSLIEEKMA